MITIAVSQYQIELLADWSAYVNKIETLVRQAKQQGAELLLLPEYAGIEIVCQKFSTDHELFTALQPLLIRYRDFFQSLAERHQITLQPGTVIEKVSEHLFVNRAYFFQPGTAWCYQDKLQLTEFEKKLGVLQSGTQQQIISSPWGKIGIAICYDSEFSEIVRNLTHSGATLILVPSYTSSLAGFNRVRLCCRARAIENQCYVAVSYAVGTIDLSDAPEIAHGQAAIFGPADVGFPDDGIIKVGNLNTVQLITAALSQKKITSVREHGQVRNFHDTKTFSQN